MTSTLARPTVLLRACNCRLLLLTQTSSRSNSEISPTPQRAMASAAQEPDAADADHRHMGRAQTFQPLDAVQAGDASETRIFCAHDHYPKKPARIIGPHGDSQSAELQAFGLKVNSVPACPQRTVNALHRRRTELSKSVGCQVARPSGVRRPLLPVPPLEPEAPMSSRKFGLNLVVVWRLPRCSPASGR